MYVCSRPDNNLVRWSWFRFGGGLHIFPCGGGIHAADLARAASVIFRGRDNTKRSTEGRSLDRGLPGGEDTCLGGRHGREGRRSGAFLSSSAMSRPPRRRRVRKRRDFFFALSLSSLSSVCSKTTICLTCFFFKVHYFFAHW